MSPIQEIVKPPETSQTIAQDVIFPPGDLYSNEPPLETEL
ncbi:MAG: Uma2 family endonuclease, partial [Symploca sp. SIO2E6]|nr:Uma2 family endonuclease [Symploca sp. SIO2E6]